MDTLSASESGANFANEPAHFRLRADRDAHESWPKIAFPIAQQKSARREPSEKARSARSEIREQKIPSAWVDDNAKCAQLLAEPAAQAYCLANIALHRALIANHGTRCDQSSDVNRKRRHCAAQVRERIGAREDGAEAERGESGCFGKSAHDE